MLWQRELVLVLGGSTYSTSIILMAFMGGLALGNLAAGKWLSLVKSEKLLYAAIQVATGLFVLAFPLIQTGLQAITGFFFSFSSEYHFLNLMLTALATFLVLLIPSMLIGAGYPVMVSQFEKMGISKNIFIGKLNFLNSLGSVFGALLTGFFLIRWLGSPLSLAGAGALFIVSGILVFWIRQPEKTVKMKNRRQPRGKSPLPENLELDIPINPGKLQALLPVLFLGSGFTALSYELLYNRILIYFLGNTTFSFTLIVALFILGYALGSFFFYALMKKKSRLSLFLNVFVLFQALIALYHLLLPAALPLLHHVLVAFKSSLLQLNWDRLAVEFLLRFASGSLLLMIPAGLFGFIFPLVFRIYFGITPAQGKTTGKVFGNLNAFNTLGSVIGPLLTGFVLIGWLQVSLTLRIISLVNILIGFSLLFFIFPHNHKQKLPKPKLLFMLAIWMLLPAVLPRKNQLGIQAAKQSSADSVVYYREGVFGTISVSVNRESQKMLKINGVGEVPTDPDSMRAFRMLAYLPFMVHQHPQRLLSIAFGGGITFGSIANTRLPKLKCVEICPDVVEAARLYSRENNRVLENRGVEILIQDGRNYVQNTGEKFDIITSDATHPASFDSWVLYTREFYLACQKKLNPNGVMAQWIPLHGLSVRDYGTILKTFSSVFKNTSLFLANSYTIILGREGKIRLWEKNFQKWVRRNPDIGKELREVNIHSITDLENCLLLDDDFLERYCLKSPVSRDRFSQLQFAELRTLKTRNTLKDNLSALLDFRQKHGFFNPPLDSYLKARILVEEEKITQALAFMQGLENSEKSPATSELQSRVFKEKAIREIPLQLRIRDIDRSIEILENHRDLYPKEGYFSSVLGYLYSKKNQIDRATELLRESIRLSPWNPSVQKIALQFFMETQNYPAARLALENLLQQNPGNKKNSALKRKLLELENPK